MWTAVIAPHHTAMAAPAYLAGRAAGAARRRRIETRLWWSRHGSIPRLSAPAPSLSVVDLEDAWRLAHELMDRHGLHGWRFEFDRAKRRAGVCRHRDKVVGLSAPITRLHPESEVRDTILHEIAHALVGPRAGHGPVWVATARRIGCTGERCVPDDAPAVPGDWVGICQQGHEVDRHRRPERVLLCTRCGGRPTGERVFEWLHHGRPATMHPNYVAELRAILEGRRLVRLGPGTRARIIAPGDFHGRVGTVVKAGRTRYHVKVREGVLTVLHAGVEPV